MVTPAQVSAAFAAVAAKTSVAEANTELGVQLAPLFNDGGGPGAGVGQVVPVLPIVASPAEGTGVVTISHAASGVVAGVYGDGSHIPVATIDSFGHVTSISVVPVIGSTPGSALPSALGVAAAGVAAAFSREDHVHPLPTASQVGAEPALGNPSANGQVLSSTVAGVRSWIDRFPASATVAGQIVVGDGAGGITSYSTLKGYSDGSIVVAGDIRSTSITPERPLFVDATTNKLYGRYLNLTDMQIIPPGTILGNNTLVDGPPLALTVSQAQALLGLSGGPFLPLAAGASNPLSGELYASQGVRGGNYLLMRDLVGYPSTGAIYGTDVTPSGTNYVLALASDGSSVYFNATTTAALDINGVDMVTATASGVTLTGTTTLSALGAGFVRSSSAGVLSSSALVAADVSGLTGWATKPYTNGSTTDVSEGTNLYYTDARARASISGSAPISYSSSTGVISHLATDGNLHVPATSTTNSGKFLKAGATAGSIAWAALTYSDLTGTVPTWNQSTTGSAAKWTTPRTLTIGATGKAVDGSANVSWSLAEIGAFPLASLAAGSAGASVIYTGTNTLGPGGWYDDGNGINALDRYALKFGYNKANTVFEINAASGTSSINFNLAGPLKFSLYRDASNVFHFGNGVTDVWSVGQGNTDTFNVNRNTSVSGSLSVTTTLSWGGGWFQNLFNEPSYTAIYGSGVAPTNAPHNYSLALAKSGAYSWLSGTTSSHLAVGGAAVASATSGLLAVTGALTATSTLAWGGGAAIPSSGYVVVGTGAGAYGHRTTNVSTFDALLPSGFYDSATTPTTPLANTWTHMIRSTHTDPNNVMDKWSFDIAANFFSGQEGYYVRTNTNVGWGAWRALWHSGNLTSATLPGGPYLPKAGTTGDFGIPISNAYIASASNLAFFGRTGYWTSNPVTSIGLTLDGSTAWLRSPTVRIMGSSYDVADFSDSTIQFAVATNVSASLSATTFTSQDASIGGMKQVASRFWSTSSVLPVMAANTWCFLVCDFTGGQNVMWTTNSTQTVSIRSGGVTYPTAVNSTLTDGGANFYANYRTMILVGPTVSTNSQCSVIVW